MGFLTDYPLPSSRSGTLARKSFRHKSHTDAIQEPGVLTLKRLEKHVLQAMMGSAVRNPLTGMVNMRGYVGRHCDFSFVDLWTRDTVAGEPRNLARDAYLFRPYPMLHRTWISHWLYNSGQIFCESTPDGETNDGMMRQVLAQSCIDLDHHCGRWSPPMAYAPICMVASISGDFVLLTMACAVLLALCILAHMLNNPFSYRTGRLATLPLRLGFTVFVCCRVDTRSVTSVLGFTGSLLGILVDFGLGDVAALANYRYTCSYEMVRALPNRVFVCRRQGAAELPKVKGFAEDFVTEAVSGLGPWQPDMILIADIAGILVELRPVRVDLLVALAQEVSATGRRVRYIALDVFGAHGACVSDLEKQASLPRFQGGAVRRMGLMEISEALNGYRDPSLCRLDTASASASSACDSDESVLS